MSDDRTPDVRASKLVIESHGMGASCFATVLLIKRRTPAPGTDIPSY